MVRSKAKSIWHLLHAFMKCCSACYHIPTAINGSSSNRHSLAQVCIHALLKMQSADNALMNRGHAVQKETAGSRSIPLANTCSVLYCRKWIGQNQRSTRACPLQGGASANASHMQPHIHPQSHIGRESGPRCWASCVRGCRWLSCKASW